MKNSNSKSYLAPFKLFTHFVNSSSTSTNHKERNFEEGFSTGYAILRLVSNFKERNKQLIIVWGSEKLSKDLETISAYTESTE